MGRLDGLKEKWMHGRKAGWMNWRLGKQRTEGGKEAQGKGGKWEKP